LPIIGQIFHIYYGEVLLQRRYVSCIYISEKPKSTDIKQDHSTLLQITCFCKMSKRNGRYIFIHSLCLCEALIPCFIHNIVDRKVCLYIVSFFLHIFQYSHLFIQFSTPVSYGFRHRNPVPAMLMALNSLQADVYMIENRTNLSASGKTHTKSQGLEMKLATFFILLCGGERVFNCMKVCDYQSIRVYLVVVDIRIVDCHMYPGESCPPSLVLLYIPAEASMQYIHYTPIILFYMVSRD